MFQPQSCGGSGKVALSRSNKPVALDCAPTADVDQVLAVKWPTANLFVSGGEDGRLLIHRWNENDEEEE